MVEVPIKISDRLKARDLLGKYHTLFTDKKEISVEIPIFINVEGWDDEAEDEMDKKYPNRTKIIDDVPLED
ncbi:hypothetical protein BU116_10355 [Staphylococcus xylosus]|nr:hypothetical protein [Staphylococcus xylosus]RIM76562.1 hypothetical protein BU116_10355 [Staphylococcus xylosus]